MSFAELWNGLEPLGRDPGTAGYRRYSWTPADAECRAWFTRQADRLGLTVEQDRNGNLWAWWGSRDAARQDAVVAGAREGERNQLCFWGACRLAELAEQQVIARDDAIAIAVEAASRAGLPPTEALRTARSAFGLSSRR